MRRECSNQVKVLKNANGEKKTNTIIKNISIALFSAFAR